MSLTKTYPLEVDSDRWDEIKSTVPHNQNLNDTLVDRLDSPMFDRSADSRGRVKLPDEYADKDVVVAVIEVQDEEEQEEDDE